MQSFVPLNWKTSDETTEEVVRAKHRFSREKKRVKSNYDQSVEDRWSKKRYFNPNYDIEGGNSRVRNDDTLVKEVEAFNQSKVIK